MFQKAETTDISNQIHRCGCWGSLVNRSGLRFLRLTECGAFEWRKCVRSFKQSLSLANDDVTKGYSDRRTALNDWTMPASSRATTVLSSGSLSQSPISIFPGRQVHTSLAWKWFQWCKEHGHRERINYTSQRLFSLFIVCQVSSLPNRGLFLCLFVSFQTPSFPLGLGSTGRYCEPTHTADQIFLPKIIAWYSLSLSRPHTCLCSQTKSTPVSPSVSLHLSSWDRFSY